MYHVRKLKKLIAMADIAPFYRRDLFMKMCGDCPHYNTVWSCPPYEFTPWEMLAQYNYALLVIIKIEFEPEVLKAYRNKDAALNFLQCLQKEKKRKSDAFMHKLERNFDDSLALLSGCCRHCEYCSRSVGIPCRDKDYLRPSLEALGYDVGSITKHIMGFPLLWFENRLPAYLALISALLLKDVP